MSKLLGSYSSHFLQMRAFLMPPLLSFYSLMICHLAQIQPIIFMMIPRSTSYRALRHTNNTTGHEVIPSRHLQTPILKTSSWDLNNHVTSNASKASILSISLKRHFSSSNLPFHPLTRVLQTLILFLTYP